MELDEAIHSCQVALGFNRLQQLWGLRTNLTKVDYHHFFGSTLYCNPFLWNKFQSFVVYTLQPFHSLTDWETWRPSILNVCTYLSSDGQLVSQGSVLRSWSIHPWPLVKDQPPTLILILIYPPLTNPQPQTVLEPPPETLPTAMSQVFSSVTLSKLPY